jgi:UDPglucose 6-dehydrogenase
MTPHVSIIGLGKVGQAYLRMFPDAVQYDEPKGIGTREAVNKCDLAIICVPTDALPDGTLDMGIVEEVVRWCDAKLILIKSALMPGTTDRLREQYGKRVCVSVEMVGEGRYFVPPWKYPDADDPTAHDFLIVGGAPDDRELCAAIFWQRMSPAIQLHLVSAVEAEIVKLMENAYGALKVTFANVMYDLCQTNGASYSAVLQAWGADGRVEKAHMRVLPFSRGWDSKCYNKDVRALATLDPSGLLAAVLQANAAHQMANADSPLL